MQTQSTVSKSAARRHRPKMLTVFASAFAAGAVLAYGVDRMVDVHVVRVEPQVESEPIFVALRSLPQGSPVTVWDVALKDWPKAMLPTTALKADASLEGMVLRHPVREGQPLLSVQLVRDGGFLPGAAVATLPVAAGPMDARNQLPATVPGATVGEPFVPAAPAEPPATTAAAAASTPAGRTTEPVPVSPPAAEPVPAATQPETVAAVVAAPATEFVPRVDSPPAEPAADHRSRSDTPALVAVVQPRSTDVDESVVAPAGAASAASPTATEPTPAVPEVAAVAVPVQAPAHAAAAEPAPIAMGGASEAPLSPPVPALPPTDIERSLAAFAPPRAAPGQSPAATGGSPAASTEQPASVLDRTTEAEPPTASQAAPKLHLVVPERIALAADASFAQPQAQAVVQAEPTVQAGPANQALPAAQEQPAARGRVPARGGSLAATAPQGRAQAQGSKPTAANPSARKQPSPRQPATRPQPPQGRGMSAWLPPFLGGGTQQSGQSRQR